MYTVAQRRKAIRLRLKGLTYSRIAREVGASSGVVRLWCDDKARKKNLLSTRDYHRRTNREYARVNLLRLSARRKGEAPLKFDAEFLKRKRSEHDGTCAICGKPGVIIDHDHKTGKFRGFLCVCCNRGLGLLGDSADRINKAIQYLKRKGNQ